MVLQLRPLFAGEIERLPIDAKLDLSSFTFHGTQPLATPATVTGAVVARAGMLFLDAAVSFVYEGECDRCLTPIRREMTANLHHVLVSSLSGEETDELVLVENDELPLEPLVESDLFVELPQKFLCREDCRGLCQYCGKNLNEGLCGCHRETTDPRLAALAALLRSDDADLNS